MNPNFTIKDLLNSLFYLKISKTKEQRNHININFIHIKLTL